MHHILAFCLLASACAAAPLNVVQQGADPTGQRDCTALLTRLHATGSPIYYPNGAYRFNGKTLDLSGGVRFESATGVTVHNDKSALNILQFDDAGHLIGLQHNHLELNETTLGGPMPTDCGTLVRPPLSTVKLDRKVDLLVHWYNDFGLECRRHGGGWIGWYYWTWNFHGAEGDGYDPARHPLLGFYRGDDPTVLDWQCYWLREYGVTGAILQTGSDLQNWAQPTNGNYWLNRLFTATPNFRGLKYVLTAPTPYSSSTPAAIAQVRQDWGALIAGVYLRYPNCYTIERGGKRYPLLYLHEEGGLTGVFDNYSGCAKTLDFYREIAALFRSKGFGGVALLARHGIGSGQADFAALERDGVLHFSGGYAETSSTGAAYADLVANFSPPTDPRAIVNTFTAVHSHTPHPSKWVCPGNTPALFRLLLEKAVAHIERNRLQPIVTCYNMAEWAEGGPGLQPSMQDRFGYLQAVRDAIVTKHSPQN